MKKTSLTALKYGLGKFLKDTRKIDNKNDSEFASSSTVYAAVITDMKKKVLQLLNTSQQYVQKT